MKPLVDTGEEQTALSVRNEVWSTARCEVSMWELSLARWRALGAAACRWHEFLGSVTTERWAASLRSDMRGVLSGGPFESGVVSQSGATPCSSAPPQPCCSQWALGWSQYVTGRNPEKEPWQNIFRITFALSDANKHETLEKGIQHLPLPFFFEETTTL